MGTFSELVKNFDKTREYVRDFFIYGFKVRSDFNRKSMRTYDDERRRTESWLGSYMRYEDTARGRKVSISADSGHIFMNPLYNAYYAKSFTDNDIKLHFFILDILSDGKNMTLREISKSIDENFGEIFEIQTIRNKLKEYVDEGIIVTQKSGKTSYFRLSEDRVQDYFSEIEGLDDAVSFFSLTHEFGVVGNSILRFAGLENTNFLIKHNYIVHTLEDGILLDILSAIDGKRYISFSTFRSSGTVQTGAVPLETAVSVQTGRRYLIAYIPSLKRYGSFRLDFIRQVKAGDVCEDYDSIYNTYSQNSTRCFGVSFGTRKEGTEPLKLKFSIDEKSEKYIIDRINREKRNGIFKKECDGLYSLVIDVFDPDEPMQWVKSFIGRIVSIEGGSTETTGRFLNDIKRMYNIYGSDKK